MARMVLILAVLVCVVTVHGQEQQKARDRAVDNFEELDSGQLTLRFFDALNAKPILGANVQIEGIDTLITDHEGKVLFVPPAEDGPLAVHFRAEGYVPSDFTIEIEAGSLFFNRYSISPVLDVRYLRVVLDWGRSPSDIDLHFLKEAGYHISYRDMESAADGSAVLDRDDTNGYGPETITVKDVQRTSSYVCYVHDYSNRGERDSGALSASKGTIKVFGQGALLKVFEVPRGRSGTRWNVFSLQGGVITESGSLQPE
jgi:hypothetical protein